MHYGVVKKVENYLIQICNLMIEGILLNVIFMITQLFGFIKKYSSAIQCFLNTIQLF